MGCHPYSYTTENLEIPISLEHMALDWKPEDPEESRKARGEHEFRTNRVEVGFEPRNPEVWGEPPSHCAPQFLLLYIKKIKEMGGGDTI